MKKLSLVPAAAGAVMIISACGSASATATNAQAHTRQTTSPAVSQPSAAGRQLEGQAQHLMSRLATLSEQVASSNRPSQPHARAEFAQRQSRLQSVATRASDQLAGNDPARRIIVQSTQRAARDTQRLKQKMHSADMDRTLTKLKNTLGGLSSDIGRLRAGLAPASTSKMLTGLRDLEQQLTVGSP